ncbi:hypothetical protein B0I32_112232 [Nonomuraea fuscirosea]|uniref:Uncharacterized protein n=1 Tax=Nonomuraea fuscirosea TaxID=1291556 RepID=A0A2T0MVC0_9ACTN|nr:hypothetical protein [Nonomuraea fuscirosea]PRX62736.1 hypothetical protein B0I32_112232 [Nonomuraea fuscirosea]
MNRSSDLAARGRLRRLTLTAVPLLLVVAAPMIMLSWYGERLPDRAYVDSWAALPQYAPSWEGWLSQQWFTLVLFEASLLFPFVCYWRLPQLQRGLVALAFFVGGSRTAVVVLSVTALAGQPGPVPAPPWHRAVEIAVTIAAAALGYLAAGRIPAPPEATAAPPAHAPTMTLAPTQRVLFVTSSWSAPRLAVAAVLGMLTGLSVPYGSGTWQGTVLLGAWTIFEVAQARTRLQIDHSGITVRAAWLPALHRTLPYPLIRFAQASAGRPPGRYRLHDGDEGWGIISGKGPALVARLSDDRQFVYSTRAAETAAALVNGWLSRQRQGETA